MKVQVDYKGEGKMFGGTIKRDNRDGTYDISYDDSAARARVLVNLLDLDGEGSVDLDEFTKFVYSDEGYQRPHQEGSGQKSRAAQAVMLRFVVCGLHRWFCETRLFAYFTARDRRFDRAAGNLP